MAEINSQKDLYFEAKGSLTLNETADFYRKFKEIIGNREGEALELSLEKVEEIDSSGVVALQELQQLARQSDGKLQLTNVPEEIDDSISIFSSEEQFESTEVKEPGFFEKVGNKTFQFYSSAVDLLYLTANTFYWAVADLFSSKKSRMEGSVVNQSVLIGVNAFPIVAMISFLVGFVLALQSAAQLRQFGANIYVADLITISMTREMGPIMTAIILAGRSGSSFASEIATMKVSEEIDALKSMALNPVRFVVVPKFYAITLCTPLLTIMSIVIGISGGALVAITYLKLSLTAFLNQAVQVLILKDIVTSIVKSFVFAWIIVLVGSFFGFQVEGGSEEVGKVTTSAVVASIFMVIVADSLLGIIFYLGSPVM